MSKKDDYITIKIPKSALSGIFSITINNDNVSGGNLASLDWGPNCNFSLYYSSMYKKEVNRVFDEISLEMLKQKSKHKGDASSFD